MAKPVSLSVHVFSPPPSLHLSVQVSLPSVILSRVPFTLTFVLRLIMPKVAPARVLSVWCPHPGSLGRTDPPGPAWERRGHHSAGVLSHRATARACKAAEGLPKCREQKSPLFPALGPASPAAHPKRPEKKDCEFFTLRSASASSAIASACFPEVSMTSRSWSAQARHSQATTPRTRSTRRSSARCADVTQTCYPT